MKFQDALTLDKATRTPEGYLVIRARAARVGVYDYAGYEVDPENKHGLRDMQSVKVLRDENTVFDTSAMTSFVGKPITIDHPREAVTADNWKRYAAGVVHGVARDGDYFGIDAIISDKAAIKAVDGGKRELSNGYSAELEFGDFTARDGTKCQARQSKITGGNHVALVDRGRAGPDCAIKDGFATCDANPAALDSILMKDMKVAKITLDGLIVDLSDADAVQAAFAKKDEAIKNTQTALDAEKAKASEATGKIAALEKELADAKAASEPAAIEAAVAARAALIADAKKVAADVVTDGKGADDIRKAVVEAKLGDAAKDMDAAAIKGAFAVLVATSDAKPTDKLAAKITDGKATGTVTNASAVSMLRDARYA